MDLLNWFGITSLKTKHIHFTHDIFVYDLKLNYRKLENG